MKTFISTQTKEVDLIVGFTTSDYILVFLQLITFIFVIISTAVLFCLRLRLKKLRKKLKSLKLMIKTKFEAQERKVKSFVPEAAAPVVYTRYQKDPEIATLCRSTPFLGRH